MRVAVLILSNLLAYSACAETFVIEIESVLGDRKLNREEQQLVQQAMEQGTGRSRGSVYRREQLKLLRQNTEMTTALKVRFLLEEGNLLPTSRNARLAH